MTNTNGKIKSLKSKCINSKSTVKQSRETEKVLKDQNSYSTYISPTGAQQEMRAKSTSNHWNI